MGPDVYKRQILYNNIYAAENFHIYKSKITAIWNNQCLYWTTCLLYTSSVELNRGHPNSEIGIDERVDGGGHSCRMDKQMCIRDRGRGVVL